MTNEIPQKALNIMALLRDAGARDVLIVGGFVRDLLLGIQSKDIDIEVYGMPVDAIVATLAPHFSLDVVGKNFGVIKIDNEVDVSIPRRESKIGMGHRDFKIDPDPNMSVEDAAARRDFTINSMAMREDGTIIDPFNGRRDLLLPVLRATSKAFQEDALRVLRAMQFAARFAGPIADRTTMDMAIAMHSEFEFLPKERIWEEWKKFATKGVSAFYGFLVLTETGWIEHFPELRAMIGVPQDPEWHPEGWSAEIPAGRDIFAINTRLTGATHPIGIDDSLTTFGQFVSSAFTQTTTRPESSSAPTAQPADVDNPCNSFPETSFAGALSPSLTSGLSETVVTQPVRFMRQRIAVATRASKIVRIMLKIPKTSMLCVMRSAINDFEILNAIVEPVSVFMMNMLFGKQWATKFQLHQNAMKSDLPIFTGPTNVSVATIVADASSATVDGNVIVSFNLCFEGDVDFTHSEFLVVDPKFPHLFYTKITQGDVWFHTTLVVQEAIDIAIREQLDNDSRMVLFFAALCHDMAKPATTKMEGGRWRAKGHCEQGADIAESFLNRIGAPKWLIEQVKPLVVAHLVHANGQPTARAVKRLAMRLHPSSISMLSRLIESDHSGRSPLPKGNPFLPWLDAAEKLGLQLEQPQPILRGRDLIQLGVKPGKTMGFILDKAFDAQLDGVFDSVDGAISWYKSHLDQ